MPVSGCNLDFLNLVEALSALQRNPQLRRQVGNGSFSATALHGVILASGTAVVVDNTTAYSVAAPGLVIPFGLPLANSPGVTAVTVSSAAIVTTVYHV